MNSLSNIPDLSLQDAISAITLLYETTIKNHIPIRTVPSVFLWGPPGIGKSQGVREIAEKLHASTNRTVTITDVRLLLFNPIDLHGIPVANADKTLAIWLKPQIFQMDASDNVVNILFLDELSAAPPAIQAAAYQICLDHKVGEHTLPDNCVVIAAGNRTTDKSVAFTMPKALANRLLHFNISSSDVSWREWAESHDIDERIIEYIKFDPSRLYVEPQTSDLAYPTPRTWEAVSNIIKILPDLSSPLVLNMVSGLIGCDASFDFLSFCKRCYNFPSIEDIKRGKCQDAPTDAESLYALVSLLGQVIIRPTTSEREIFNICTYISRFPKDYISVFINDIKNEKNIYPQLALCHAFQNLVAMI